MWYYNLQTILQYATIFIFSSIAFLMFYYKHAFTYWKSLGVPHVKPSFPFGNMDYNFTTRSAQFVTNIYFDMKNKGHKFCGYYMFAMPVFVPISPEVINYFLAANFNCFHDRGVYVDEKNDPVGWNLVTMTGEKWKRMRELVSPTWTAGKVKMMFPLMHKCTDDLEVVINELVKKKEDIDIFDIAKRLTVDVICTCALGIGGNALKNINNDILRHGKMIFNAGLIDNLRISLGLTAPKIAQFFKMNAFNPASTNFFQTLVHELVEYREKHNIETKDFLNLLIRLKNNKPINYDEESYNKINRNISVQLTVDEIAAQCFIFFLAGFETTAGAIKYCMYEIAKNQDIQDKIRQEVIRTMKKFDNKLSYDAIKEMRYLENVYHESLRKYPVVHMLNRICTKDFTIPNSNITVQKGTKVVIPVFGVHMDPEYYPNPETFDPDRFTDEAKAARPSYVYLPFGDGPRICPGNRFAMIEVKLCIAFLLLKYRFTVCPSSEKLTFCCFGNMLATENPILLTADHLNIS